MQIDKRHVWHPYTPMRRYIDETDPLVVVAAKGARLVDADGRSYLDAISSWWVAALGHGHPRVVEALCAQARELGHVSLAGVTHEPAARLAAALTEVAPAGLSRVFFSDDGSTALEAAVKLAIGYQARRGRPRRTKFLALSGAFHGETLGVTALGGVEVFRRPYADVLMEVVFAAPAPEAERDGGPAHLAIERTIAEHEEELAGVVIEPMVQGAAGMRIHPASFLRAVARACQARGILLIADEVFTGYGRTGPFWAVDHAGVMPDLLCTAKAFSGGILPMAATLASEEVFEAFLEPAGSAFYYGHSFCGNPLGARVALEVLSIYRDERVLEGVVERAPRIRDAFLAIGQRPGASAARAIGMIGAVDLGDQGYAGRTGWRVYDEARRRGAYLRPLGDTVYVAPPLNIPLADLDELLEIVAASVDAALAG